MLISFLLRGMLVLGAIGISAPKVVAAGKQFHYSPPFGDVGGTFIDLKDMTILSGDLVLPIDTCPETDSFICLRYVPEKDGIVFFAFPRNEPVPEEWTIGNSRFVVRKVMPPTSKCGTTNYVIEKVGVGPEAEKATFRSWFLFNRPFGLRIIGSLRLSDSVFFDGELERGSWHGIEMIQGIGFGAAAPLFKEGCQF